MKKLLIFLMLVSLSLAGIATSTKTAAIREGSTMLSQPLGLTAADSLRGLGGSFIVTGDSLVVLISNPQKYLQYHTVTSTLAVRSGSGTITVNFYGKTTSGESWHPIGTDATYTTGSTPVTVTGTTPANYNYLRVSYVQSGGTESAKLTAFEIRTVNAFPYGATRVTGTAGLTVTGGTVNLNVSSNNAINVGTGTTTSTITIGGAGAQTIAIGNGAAAKTVALGSSNSTSTTTLLSGSGGLLLNASNNQPTNIGTGTSTGLVTIGGGSGTAAINTSAWDISSAGVVTGLGTVNGLTIANGIGRIVTTATASTDSTSAGSFLAAVDQYVTVTSGGATRTIILPTAAATTVGLTIEGYVGANGFDLRVPAAQALTVKINDVTGSAAKGVEAAIPATTKFTVVCVSATEWNLTGLTELGAVITAIVPSTIEKR
jgi:hypothetical protein